MEISELKVAAKEKLRGNWGWAAKVTLIILIIQFFIPGRSVVSSCICDLFNLGLVIATYDLIQGNPEKRVFAAAFSQFTSTHPHRTSRVLSTWLLTTIYENLWTLLFLIPGIVKSYSYSQAVYIIIDYADQGIEMTPNEAITLSRELMDGHKFELFALDVSFIGWLFLSIITFGIGSIWFAPYLRATKAEFYKHVRAQYDQEHSHHLAHPSTSNFSYSAK